jgi:hypothetical protein
MSGEAAAHPSDSPRRGEVLVHVGFHKTATSWLQSFLFDDLRARFRSPFSRAELLENFVLVNPLRFDAPSLRSRIEGQLTALQRDGLVPVLSHERLSGNPHSGGYDRKDLADRLHDVLPRARILVTIREQHSMILSVYKQYVREGGALPLRRYLHPPHRGIARVPMFSFDFFEYDLLVAYYQQLFGAECVLVLPFELLRSSTSEFVGKIVRFAGGSVPSRISHQRENVALSGLSTALKRCLNRLLVRDRVNLHGWVDSERWNTALVRGLESLDRLLPRALREGPDRRLREIVARQVGDRYRESNRRTSALIGLNLREFGYDA